jgi:hypothetical protein
VRSSLIAASPRRRFLAARLITIGAVTIGLFGALAILGVVLSLVLHLVGAELPPATIAIDPLAAIGTVLAELLAAFTIVAFAVALTVIVRSGAIPILLVLIVLAADAFLANLPVFLVGELFAGVPQFSLTTSIRTLVTTLAPSSGALAFAGLEPPPAAIAIPSWGVALIICAWLGLFLVIADRRFRTMDIVE